MDALAGLGTNREVVTWSGPISLAVTGLTGSTRRGPRRRRRARAAEGSLAGGAAILPACSIGPSAGPRNRPLLDAQRVALGLPTRARTTSGEGGEARRIRRGAARSVRRAQRHAGHARGEGRCRFAGGERATGATASTSRHRAVRAIKGRRLGRPGRKTTRGSRTGRRRPVTYAGSSSVRLRRSSRTNASRRRWHSSGLSCEAPEGRGPDGALPALARRARTSSTSSAAYRAALERYERRNVDAPVGRWGHARHLRPEIRKFNEEVVRTLDDEAVASISTILPDTAARRRVAPRLGQRDRAPGGAARPRALPEQRCVRQVTMLARLADAEEWIEWETLSREYFFADPEIRASPLVGSPSRRGSTRVLRRCRRRLSAGRASEGGTSSRSLTLSSPPTRRGGSPIRRSRSPLTGSLSRSTRASRAYAEPLADWFRSFGAQRPALYVAASPCSTSRRPVYRTDIATRRARGGARPRGGDLKAAARSVGARLTRARAGRPSVRLEVATLFWDYYQFDAAAGQLCVAHPSRDARSTPSGSGPSSTEGATRVGRFPRGLRRRRNRAGASRAGIRLAELSRRGGCLPRPDGGLPGRRTAAPSDWQLRLLADFLRALDRTGEAVACSTGR